MWSVDNILLASSAWEGDTWVLWPCLVHSLLHWIIVCIVLLAMAHHTQFSFALCSAVGHSKTTTLLSAWFGLIFCGKCIRLCGSDFQVKSVELSPHTDYQLKATVQMENLQEAISAVNSLHRYKIGSKRIQVSLATGATNKSLSLLR